ncbi:MAG: cytochrome b/b6 domain-containing protein [Hydrogenophilales bacterium]|nr:cytochrome b/b6 domain-containing protein [Hydrogenophilales bacterium]
MTQSAAQARVRVWDVPVRLFHWLLLALIGFSWWSGEQGNEWMEYHGWSGYAILTLLLFRIAWGFAGSDTARFAHFVRGPRASYAYFRSVLHGQPKAYLGHNPLGGWMILSLMLVLLVQAITGLLGNDDDAYEAPLAHWLQHDTSSLITTLHAYNFDLLLGLVGVHVAAVLTHQLRRRDDMIKAMFTGMKTGATGATAGRMVSSWRALVLLGLMAALVYALLWMGGGASDL